MDVYELAPFGVAGIVDATGTDVGGIAVIEDHSCASGSRPSAVREQNWTGILPSTATVMSSPGCECGGYSAPAFHRSGITSVPSALFGQLVPTENPAGKSVTAT